MTNIRSEARGGLVIVWGPPSHGPRSRILAAGLEMDVVFVHRTRRRGLLAAPMKYPYQAVETLRLLRRRRPDLIVVQSPPSLAAWTVALYARRAGVPFVIDAHTDALLTPYWTWPRWLTRRVARRAAATLVTNVHLAGIVRSWGARAIVVPDVPVELEAGSAPERDDRFTVTVVSSFGPDEPLSAILEAAARLPDVAFLVTGSLTADRGRRPASVPPNVRFTDYLPDPTYHGLLRSSDAVLCLTTRDHTMQRGACEALAMGTPIITSRWPVLEEHFHKGAVHVDNSPEGIRDGVDAVRAEPERLRREVVELRDEHRRHWDRVRVTLLRDLVGSDDRSRSVPAEGR